MKECSKKPNNGFSLVELIIVIAIMAILVGILAPNLMKNIEKARVSKDKEVVDSIANAVAQGIIEEYAYADFCDVCDSLPYSVYLDEIYTMSQQPEGSHGYMFASTVISTIKPGSNVALASKGVRGKHIYTDKVILVEISDSFSVTITAVGAKQSIKSSK